jgi:photosystem II stability/assembly factor-like uncharacterized protein
MRTRMWLFLAAGTLFFPVAQAGTGVWTSGGPYGGGVGVLAVDPASPSTIYAGGSGGVFKSVDSGGTWTAANTGLTSASVDILAIDPANPATLYVGTFYAGVFKSTDSGGTWAPANIGLTTLAVTALAIDPSNTATLYAGGPDGVFRSIDAGRSWATTGLTDEYVGALAVDPSNPAVLYAGMIYRGVFKSSDSGGTWAPINTGLALQQVFALAVDPAHPATVYTTGNAAGVGGIFKSTDSGGTWAAADAGLTNLGFVNALAIDPSHPATLYVGASTPEPGRLNGGLFKSTDSGGTWTAASAGLTDTQIYAVAVSPSNPALLYTGTGSGVFRSTDSGGTWTVTNTGLTLTNVQTLVIDPANPARLYAGTNGGVFRSIDSGGTWTAVNAGLAAPDVQVLAIDPSNPATLYAGGSGGVFKSTDSGGTWAAASTGLAGLSVFALVVDPSNPATLYAGTGGGGVFKSIDAGGTWVAANTGLTGSFVSVSSLAINPANPATLYAGTNTGIYKSTDAGGTWSGLTSLGVNVLAINPANPATLYAGTGGAVLKSTDAGATWAATSTGLEFVLPFATVRALAISPGNPTTLYAGAFGLDGGRVFRSIDAGGTWAPVDAGLPHLSVYALALDPTGPTTLYVGLAGGGAWQSTAPAEATTTLLLPTSAHAGGAGGAFYTTDVFVSNGSGANASFTLKFLGHDRDGSTGPEKTFDLDAGASTTFLDVLGSVFDETNDFGAIRITSSTSLLDVVSVTSTPGFGGTFGQSIPAFSASNLIPAGSARSILYLREGDGFRTNLVLASGASVSTAVDALLVSPAGAVLATKSYSVPPDGMTQINRVVRDMGVSGALTGARLVLSSSTTGALFTGVASVIDETTNDSTAMTAQPVMNGGPGLATPGVGVLYSWLLPACARSNGLNGSFYTTNVAVANVGVSPASFTFKFLGHDQDGSAGPEQTLNLESGKSITYFDVLGSVFNQTSTFGAIRITADSPFLNIVSVTSTPGFGGTFGQAIPAVTPLDFISAGRSVSILGIREGDGFRSNLVLASTRASATVDAVLVSPAGTTLATKSYSVPPNGMTQINRVVRDMGVSGPITGARLVLSSPNGAFTGLASVIDETTNDPTAIVAQ